MRPLILVAAMATTLALCGCATPSLPTSSPITPPTRSSTLAGDGSAGAIDGTPSRVNRPHGLALAGNGAVVFADRGNHQVRAVDRNGAVATLAGSGRAGFADGPMSQAQFDEPIAVAVERNGTIYVADRNNHRIRKVRRDGIVSTLAGDGQAGFADGDASTARFNQPYGLALDVTETTLYVADYLNHAIRAIDLISGTVSTLAGNGSAGLADGRGAAARFNQPYNVRVDAHGALWVPDQLNHALRRVSPAGDVRTVAGSGQPGSSDGQGAEARFSNPTGAAPLPDGRVVVADRNNNRLRLVSSDGVVATLAGSDAGYADGPLPMTRFNQPLDLVYDTVRSRLLVSEDKGHRIRQLDAGAR